MAQMTQVRVPVRPKAEPRSPPALEPATAIRTVQAAAGNAKEMSDAARVAGDNFLSQSSLAKPHPSAQARAWMSGLLGCGFARLRVQSV